MQTIRDLEARLTTALALDRAPVGVSFRPEPPAGVRKFMGQAPSGCSFWSLAASAPAGKSAFYTVPSDHYSCPIGSYTHGLDLPADRAGELTGVLGYMAEIGYVKMEEVPSIPRWAGGTGAVVYARLGEAPIAPDVVVLAVRPGAAMLLGEAARAAGCASSLPPLPRPTCMAIPAAAGQGMTTSYACVGNRVYTELDGSHLYVMVKGADLEAIAGALDTILAANSKLAAYHGERKTTLTQPDRV